MGLHPITLPKMRRMTAILLLLGELQFAGAQDLSIGVVPEADASALFRGYGTEFCRADFKRGDGGLIAVVRNSEVILMQLNGATVSAFLYRENGGILDTTEYSFADRTAPSDKAWRGRLVLSQSDRKVFTGRLTISYGTSGKTASSEARVTDGCAGRDGQLGRGIGWWTLFFRWLAD